MPAYSESETTRVAIVEDDPGIRAHLAELIAGTPGYVAPETYPSAEEALRGIPKWKPEVVLMDIHLPGASGIECTAKLRILMPDLPIVMLTVYEDVERVFQALRAGAIGYLVKRTPADKLLEGIQDAKAGSSPMSGHIARKVVQAFQSAPPAKGAAAALSPREREILERLADGYLYKEIAEALGIGIATVTTHINHIYQKLHVRTRTEAVAKFLRAP